MRILLFLCIISLSNQSCNNSDHELSENEKQKNIASATEVVKKVFELSNEMDFVSGLNHYADDPNSYFITDGIMHSLSDLKKAYENIGPSVEALHNTIESWNAQMLSPNIVTFTLPVKLTLKLKDTPEYTGQLIWTAVLEKQGDEWLIVQSHESWLNCAEVVAALTPKNNN